MIKGSELNCKISGIKENVTYVAKISAINAAGEGQFSELRTFSRGEWWTEERRGIEGDGGMDRGGGGRGSRGRRDSGREGRGRGSAYYL